MMTDLTAHIANTSGLGEPQARQALGIVLNAAERQDSALASTVFRAVPGARQLAARAGSDIGAPTGEIARLIEQTPGGRRRVVAQMFSALHALGLSHAEIAAIPGAIASWMQTHYGTSALTGLGSLIAHDADAAAAAAAAARAA
ncbi:hypothetical protein [Hyphomonas sp.]|uniref:hypothetical protein n=1 Tax=Hyphomonas sp. TaxID=87 RepID=UPI0039199A35